jgi:pimeloyl-ACP methyl ester carboxylesterase
VISAPGPWQHRDIAANGSRFHVVEAGSGPAVLLLHGFPTFWWSWRDHITRIADAGFRAIAMDLRGYAGSDHPPHGYDPFTLSNDVAGVIRSMGEESATIVGHGWGGLIAWSMPVLTPDVVHAIAPVSMPHPRRLRRALLRDGLQRGRSMYAIGFQWPFLPERSLMAGDCERVGELISEWSATPGFPDAATSDIYRSAFSLWPTAHCAVEYHRWAFRSFLRSDGLRYARRMETPIGVPVLHLQGAEDASVLPRVAEGSDAWVEGDYEFALLPEVGHFPHEENPAGFADVLMPWLDRHRTDQRRAG